MKDQFPTYNNPLADFTILTLHELIPSKSQKHSNNHFCSYLQNTYRLFLTLLVSTHRLLITAHFFEDRSDPKFQILQELSLRAILRKNKNS